VFYFIHICQHLSLELAVTQDGLWIGLQRSRSFNGVGGVGKDSADVGGGSRDSGVSVFCPDFTPGVLHEEVFFSLKSSVSDGEYCVIELLTAHLCDDSISVSHESGLVGFDGNRYWLFGNCGFELLWRVGGNIGDPADLSDSLRGVKFAFSIFRDVRVVAFKLEGIGLDVLVSKIHFSSLHASSGRAVYDLLLGERLELSSFDGQSSLDGSNGGESPARIAYKLVLGGGNGVHGSPVDFGGKSFGGKKGVVACFFKLGLIPEHVLDLGLGSVGEVVDSDG